MGKESVIRINDDIFEPPEDNQLTTPRCSTPIFDGSSIIVSPVKTSSHINRENNNNDVRLYREWKLRLQRGGKPRIFKVRGGNKKIKTAATNDCSIISGHFESEVNVGAAATATPTATPVYQMWFPFGYPGFWTPAHHGCQHQNHLWSYGTAHIQPHYQIPSTFFGPAELFFANFCQRIGYQPAQVIQCNANHPANLCNPNIHWPQGTHYQVHHHNHNHNHPFHPTYSAAPSYPQFLNRGTVI